MKISKFLTICFVVLCCLFIGNLYAVCSSGLLDILGPNGGTYSPGDTICYSVRELIPDDASFCTYTNFQVYFFAPDNPPNTGDACTATNGVLVIDEATFGPNDDVTVDCFDDSALEYIASPDDVVEINKLKAQICTKFLLDGEPDSDSKTITNTLIQPDFSVFKECVNPEGTLVGEDAEFKITITNTGDVELYFIINDASAEPPLVDVPVGPIAPDANYMDTITISTTGECEDDLLVSNEVQVAAYLPDANEPFDTKSNSADCPVLCPPDFTVEKICLTDPVTDEPNALFEIIITNTGYVPLTFELDDDAAGITDMPIGPINPGDSNTINVEVPVECVDGSVSNRAVVQAYYDDSPVLDPKQDEAECPCAGLEGCTPGYWKNSPDCWCDSYEPTTKLYEVFNLPNDPTPNTFFEVMGQKTMMQAMSLKGGPSKEAKFRLLLRHAVPAILNACNENVEFPASVSYVQDSVNDVIDNWESYGKAGILAVKNEFAYWNELGCPISSDNSANPCTRNMDEY